MKTAMAYRIYIWNSFLLCLLMVTSNSIFAQTTDTILTCQSNYVDLGGVTGDYLPNQDRIITYCPDSSSSGLLQVRFHTLDLGAGDLIRVFDGDNINAPQLDVLSRVDQVLPYIYQASAQNPSRCLTFQFVSDSQEEAAGWEATVNCVGACQTIIADIIGTDPNANMQGYIDVCPGERILFFGDASYPENGTLYEHSNENATYLWDFGDGNYAKGANVSHSYLEPGGYTVKLIVRDPFGCENTNTVIRKVRVAPNPDFQFTVPKLGPLCIGDTVELSSNKDSIDPASTINILAGTAEFSNRLYQRSEEAIPDGTIIPLISTLLVTDFAPGQTLSSPTDLLHIGLDIEHSRLEDLSLSLECPNGQQINLHNTLGFSPAPTFLGSPNIGDEGRVQPGTASSYFWANTTGLSTWNETIANIDPPVLPEGLYAPEGDFSDLVGCPLNGEWKLILQDTQVTSNGFLFNWQLEFQKNLFPDLETFENSLLSQEFIFEPTVVDYQFNTIKVAPEDPGSKFYQIQIADVSGCTYDTTFQIDILPENALECTDCSERYEAIQDTFLCEGQAIDLSIQSSIPEELPITFTSDPRQSLGFANFPPTDPYRAPLLVQGVAQDTFTNPILQIESVCLNINTDFAQDIAIFLESPSGQILELSTNNGGGFDNYNGTCFTPVAPNPITIGSPPFKGNFAPEGNWSDLRGASINGLWHLIVSDEFDLQSFGEVVDWEITFRSINDLDIEWQPAEGLSCQDCPNPTASPNTTTTYQVNFTDGYGCTFEDEFTITVYDTFPAPEIICGPLSPGNMIFNWDKIPDAPSYDAIVTINGIDSIYPNPLLDTFLVVGGLVFGDEVSLRLNVSPSFEDYPCNIGVGTSTCTFEDCFTFTQIERVTDVNCNGDSTGSVQIKALRGFRPFTYYLNGDFIGQQDSIFSNLPAGDYEVVTEDMTGCSDTLTFAITEPDPIINTLQQIGTIACYGDTTASILAEAIGGTGSLSLAWNYPGLNDPKLLENLPAGNYVLTTIDSLACQRVDSILISSPPEINISANLTEISCNGEEDGQISIQLSGGTGTLNYTWSNGVPDTTIINLSPGIYNLDIIDQNGCMKDTSYSLIAPEQLTIDTAIFTTVSCFGRSNGSAEVFPLGGTLPYDYFWIDTLSQRNALATNLPGGAVDVRIVDARGCQISQTLQVPEPAPLVITFDQKNVSCLDGSDASITSIVEGGTSPFSYSWSTGSTELTIENQSEGSYSFTVTDNNNCREVNTTTISQPSTELVVSAVQADNGCFGIQQNIASVSASGGGTTYTYLWSDGQTAATATDLDSTVYEVSVTDNNGCMQTTSVKLTDLPEMNPNMIINQPSCFGDSDGAIGINFIEGRENADLNDFQFLWNTGQVGSTINNLVGDSLYTVTVTDPKGCQAKESRLVRQPKLITFQMIPEHASCFGGNNGSITVENISADTDDFTFIWDSRTGNQTTARADNLSAGVYTVTITDNQGCFNLGQATVNQPEQIQVDFKKVNNSCFGDQAGAVTAIASGGIPGYRYSWANGRTGATLENLSAGNYQLTVSDVNGCFSETNVSIEQPETIDINLETQDVSCFGSFDGSIVVNTNGGAPPYQYSINQGERNGSPIAVGLEAGDYTISILDANGCNYITSATINTPPPLEVNAGDDEYTIVLGDSLTLTAEAQNAQGEILFEWIEPFPGALNCLLCEEITVKPAYTISYELIGIDSAGCQDNDFIKVFVQKDQVIAVPTGFTPNGDGRNDELIVHGAPQTLINVFRVYDRHGELVFALEDITIEEITNGWNGQFNGQEMPSDTYLWFIEAVFDKQITKVFRGTTTLIR